MPHSKQAGLAEAPRAGAGPEKSGVRRRRGAGLALLTTQRRLHRLPLLLLGFKGAKFWAANWLTLRSERSASAWGRTTRWLNHQPAGGSGWQPRGQSALEGTLASLVGVVPWPCCSGPGPAPSPAAVGLWLTLVGLPGDPDREGLIGATLKGAANRWLGNELSNGLQTLIAAHGDRLAAGCCLARHDPSGSALQLVFGG